MDRTTLNWLLGLSAFTALLYYLSRERSANTAIGSESLLSSGLTALSASISGWKNTNEGPGWVPSLNMAEQTHGIPADLLARIAYQESHFRDDIIRGTTASGAGALGMMQLMPQYFQSVNVPRPYTDSDVIAQIDEAAKNLSGLYNSTGSWHLALAAYNAGLGNVQKYGGIPPFAETQNYVAQITADVPAIRNA